MMMETLTIKPRVCDFNIYFNIAFIRLFQTTKSQIKATKISNMSKKKGWSEVKRMSKMFKKGLNFALTFFLSGRSTWTRRRIFFIFSRVKLFFTPWLDIYFSRVKINHIDFYKLPSVHGILMIDVIMCFIVLYPIELSCTCIVLQCIVFLKL